MSVQSPWSQNGRVDTIQSIGCADHHDAFTPVEAVQVFEKPVHHLRAVVSVICREGVTVAEAVQLVAE
ncbi:hypothetical protein D3C80_1097880 [compost metagenome]